MKSKNSRQDAGRRLSGVDAAFLYLERKEIPLHIAGVMIFDGPIPFDRFVESIDRKLHLIPRYRQVVVEPPCNLGYPKWEDDPDFDIRRHIFRVRLDPPGGETELEALTGRILSELMDRGKPLWDIHIIEGMEGGKSALIARVHHSLADGIAGAAILNVMFDSSPDAPPPPPQPKFRPRARNAQPPALGDLLRDSAYTTIQNLITAEKGLLGMAQMFLGGRAQEGIQGPGSQALRQVLPEFAASVERLPFNKPCTGQRGFCWTECDFADVKAIRAVAGGTVNDVVLTALTRAIARYVKLHGETVARRFVRVVCPVNLRNDKGESLGNQITFLPVALPMDVRDPLALLKGVSSRMATMKSAGAAEMVALLAAWICAAPPPLQALFWGGLPLLTFPVPVLNIICTNIPGSPTPLYAAGRRMLASYPQVPTGYELGIGVAVQSYAGKLFFGFISDTHAAPDARKLRDFMKEAFEELLAAAGVKKAEVKPEEEPAPAARPRPARKRKAAAAVVEEPAPVAAKEPAPAARRRPARKRKAAAAVVEEPAPVPAEQPAPVADEVVPVSGGVEAEPVAVGVEAGS